MKFDKKYIIIAAIILVVLVYLFHICKKEYFSDIEFKVHKPEVYKTYFVSKKGEFIANGAVYKHVNKDVFNYIFKFNLPIPQGGDYNKIDGKYIVVAGNTTDDAKPVGELKRLSDGWFYLEVKSKEEFKYAQIGFTSDGKSVVLFENNI